MEKLNPETPDLAQAQIEQLRELFPECVTEGPDGLAVDFDALRQALSSQVVEGPQERYTLDWPGKREAAAMANQPTDKTLRPARDESVDFDTTQNLFIEGDNLEVLKLIQETYLGQVKMIYIDPPYNTGNDFIYRDDFKQAREDYEAESGQRDEAGNRLVPNPESNGRFHSDWLSMMYPRLKLARNLLSDDGVIFISIDDGEVANLKRVTDKIYGESNFISSIARVTKTGGAKGTFFTPNFETILVYAKSLADAPPFRTSISQDQIDNYYNKIETTGERQGERYGEERLFLPSLDPRPNQRYWIECPDGSHVIPPGTNYPKDVLDGSKVLPTSEDGCWRWTYATFLEAKNSGRIIFKETKTSSLVNQDGNKSKYNLYFKLWLRDQQAKGKVPGNLISDIENRQSSKELKNLGIPFDFPKPSKLIAFLIEITRQKKDAIILDFFAGSATTAHAVMQLNAKDGGSRRFVMVQLPEGCKEETEAFKAGYKNIAEISKERIRRAGKTIVEGKCHDDWNKDIGFRVLKVDESNLNAVRQTPDAISQESLLDAVENIKPDRSEEDLLFDVMLRWGVDLAAPVECREIDGKTVFLINEDDLVACFDPSITEDFVKRLTDLKPLKIVFRDDAFASDDVKINTVQIFKQASPDTEVRSI